MALLLPTLARAAPPAEEQAVPRVLDPDFRHNARLQMEIAPYGGSLLGSQVGGTWVAGVHAWFHIDDMFVVGASYGLTYLYGDTDSRGDAITDPRVHLLSGELALKNAMAIRLGSAIVEADLYLTLGGGALLLNETWGVLGVLGGGVKFYTGVPWLAIRLDVDSYMHGDGGSFQADMGLTLGVCFLFPAQAPRRQRKAPPSGGLGGPPLLVESQRCGNRCAGHQRPDGTATGSAQRSRRRGAVAGGGGWGLRR